MASPRPDPAPSTVQRHGRTPTPPDRTGYRTGRPNQFFNEIKAAHGPHGPHGCPRAYVRAYHYARPSRVPYRSYARPYPCAPCALCASMKYKEIWNWLPVRYPVRSGPLPVRFSVSPLLPGWFSPEGAAHA